MMMLGSASTAASRRFLIGTATTTVAPVLSTLRALSSTSKPTTPDLPRITEKRATETGRGGRASDAGIKVALFGGTGFLGRYVCCHLGEYRNAFTLTLSRDSGMGGSLVIVDRRGVIVALVRGR